MNDHSQRPTWSRRLYGALPTVFLLVLLAVVAGLFIMAQNKGERLAAEKKAMARKERPPVNVVVQKIVPRLVRERLNLPAMIEPWVDLPLLAEVGGMIQEVRVDEGDRVRKGDLLARIDSRDYENSLKSIRADYRLAIIDRDRLRGLFAKGIIARARLDTVEARVKTLAAAMATAALQLERCAIIAPISGVVNTLPAEVGRFLAVGDPVAGILQIDRVKVVLGIPESDVDAVRKIDWFAVTVDAVNKKFQAQKYFLAVAPESMAQLYRLELAVANQDNALLPGMFARVEVVKQSLPRAIAIPLYAVISRDNKNYVYLDDGGKAVAREVKLGILDGWQIQVREGLVVNDRVIVVGHREVDTGQMLNVVRVVTDPRELVR
ncbi:MAG: efflux RND transporter periplasmic adaptor subunit [Desulfobacterales bacterium]|nr:efflux RND transporter periplasmic adaptor subunit [Desulfobacterales bacterium]